MVTAMQEEDAVRHLGIPYVLNLTPFPMYYSLTSDLHDDETHGVHVLYCNIRYSDAVM